MPDPPTRPLLAAWVAMILILQTCMVEGMEGVSGLRDIASAQSGEGSGMQRIRLRNRFRVAGAGEGGALEGTGDGDIWVPGKARGWWA